MGAWGAVAPQKAGHTFSSQQPTPGKQTGYALRGAA